MKVISGCWGSSPNNTVNGNIWCGACSVFFDKWDFSVMVRPVWMVKNSAVVWPFIQGNWFTPFGTSDIISLYSPTKWLWKWNNCMKYNRWGSLLFPLWNCLEKNFCSFSVRICWAFYYSIFCFFGLASAVTTGHSHLANILAFRPLQSPLLQ